MTTQESTNKSAAVANGSREQEFVDEETAQARGIVANDAVFLEEIVADDAQSELQKLVAIQAHLFGVLRAIPARDFR